MTLAQDRRDYAITGKHLRLFIVAGLVSALPYAVGVLLPYYVNGLNRLPLSEVASGLHDPGDLWPHSGLVSLAGFLGTGLLPIAMLSLALVSGGTAVWATRGRRAKAPIIWGLLAVTVASAAVLMWTVGPTGMALAAWRAD
jgi:hypothetical protein